MSPCSVCRGGAARNPNCERGFTPERNGGDSGLRQIGTMAAGSFSSGQLLTSFGWNMVNEVVFGPVVLACVALAATAATNLRVIIR